MILPTKMTITHFIAKHLEMTEGMHRRSSMYFISRLYMKPGAIMDSFNPSSDHQPTSQLKYSEPNYNGSSILY